MSLFETFSHYLSYGATDQQTLRDLSGSYDGVVVPGTMAAYQRQGTGGFVLALSASDAAPPYVIDPRFPLFQQRLQDPKRSHRALADVFGFPDLVVTGDTPRPGDFGHAELREMAQNWVRFNDTYQQDTGSFDKYARRLREQIPITGSAQPPERVIAPYFMADGPEDPWWELSTVLWEATKDAAGERAVRVVAAKSVPAFDKLIDATTEAELVIWVSHLDELTSGYRELRQYAQSLARASARGTRLFALYGGFYHVLMAKFGLCGLSHGIGFGESRTWEELPQSGPPPARYYLRRAHRYVIQDLANSLALADPVLTECPCTDCREHLPLELSYHGLMRHSVAARAEEIRIWADVERDSVAAVLRSEFDSLDKRILTAPLADPLKRTARGALDHLTAWANAFDPPDAAGQ
jgi:hypothetical protein